MATKISIWDNEGETLDRYTVLIYNDDETGSVFGMSENAKGFNQYCGDAPNEYPFDLSHCGKKLESIPDGIKNAIIDRLEDNQSKEFQLI